jgi:hypothetical protein
MSVSDMGVGGYRTLFSVESGRSSSIMARLRWGACAYTISTLEVRRSVVEWVEDRVASFDVASYFFPLFPLYLIIKGVLGSLKKKFIFLIFRTF